MQILRDVVAVRLICTAREAATLNVKVTPRSESVVMLRIVICHAVHRIIGARCVVGWCSVRSAVTFKSQGWSVEVTPTLCHKAVIVHASWR